MYVHMLLYTSVWSDYCLGACQGHGIDPYVSRHSYKRP